MFKVESLYYLLAEILSIFYVPFFFILWTPLRAFGLQTFIQNLWDQIHWYERVTFFFFFARFQAFLTKRMESSLTLGGSSSPGLFFTSFLSTRRLCIWILNPLFFGCFWHIIILSFFRLWMPETSGQNIAYEAAMCRLAADPKPDLIWSPKVTFRRQNQRHAIENAGAGPRRDKWAQQHPISCTIHDRVMVSMETRRFPRSALVPVTLSSGIISNGARQSHTSRVRSASTPPHSLHTTGGETSFISITLTLFRCAAVHGLIPDEATRYPSAISTINYLNAFSFLLDFSFLLLCQKK